MNKKELDQIGKIGEMAGHAAMKKMMGLPITEEEQKAVDEMNALGEEARSRAEAHKDENMAQN